MSGSPTTTPVLIAGGGPVGVTLAMELASRGVDSIILEQRRDTPPSPRCNTTNARSMEIFRRLGVADAVRAAGLPADHNTDVVYMTQFSGHELTRYKRPTSADWAAGTQQGLGADWPTPEPQHFISQMYVEPVLRSHARHRFGVDLREGWRLSSFRQDADGVSAMAQDVDTGKEIVLRADYLVGADGGASLVRREIGARLEGDAQVGRRVSTFFSAPALHDLYKTAPGWMYRFVGGCNLVAIDGGDLWLAHNRVPPGADLETFDPWPDIFEAVGRSFDREVLQQARWTPRAMVANKLREGRVFLAGDAAHIWVPMGGFGMNAGVADAAALGWMLAGVERGWLSPGVLDAYEAERAPLGDRVAGQAAKWIRDLAPLTGGRPSDPPYQDPEQRRTIGERIRAVNIPEFDCPGMQLGYSYQNSPIILHDDAPSPPFSLETYEESSWPGVRAPHLWLADGRALYDALGEGFALLRIGEDAPSGEAMTRAAEARGLPWTVVDLPQAEAVAKYQGYGLVLVRPDQHVAWRGRTEPGDSAAILDKVTGVLAAQRTVATLAAEVIGGGFGFGEGLRWRGGRLYLSDMTGRAVLSFDPASRALTTVCRLDHQPNGLGFLPDGRLIVASMQDARLYVLGPNGLAVHTDLSGLVTGFVGDLTADGAGRVYVDDTGWRLGEGDEPAPGRILLVEPDGAARVVLDGLAMPNGMVITPDGKNLIFAETRGGRLSQARIGADGGLSGLRPFATIEGGGVDGMAVDAAGRIWACRLSGGIDGYDSAGRLIARIETPAGPAISCAVGGPGGMTLYIAGAHPPPEGATLLEAIAARTVTGWLAQAALEAG